MRETIVPEMVGLAEPIFASNVLVLTAGVDSLEAALVRIQGSPLDEVVESKKEKKEAEKKKAEGLFVSYTRWRSKIDEPEYQVRGQVEKNHRQFKVTHHGVIDFGKALFGYLDRRSVNPKHPVAGKDKSDNPVEKDSQVNDRAPA